VLARACLISATKMRVEFFTACYCQHRLTVNKPIGDRWLNGERAPRGGQEMVEAARRRRNPREHDKGLRHALFAKEPRAEDR
jgi:hypothetical protein